MKLRMLKEKDAPLMLEWMHDISVVEDLKADFPHKTTGDCEEFIKNSAETGKNLHMAVVDDDDTYMGTVSLKHIGEGMAEFGIVVRKSAMGKGYAHYAMNEIIRIGFERLELKMIYWCVSPENLRAVRFYDKNSYHRMNSAPEAASSYYSEEELQRYIWYDVSVKEQQC